MTDNNEILVLLETKKKYRTRLDNCKQEIDNIKCSLSKINDSLAFNKFKKSLDEALNLLSIAEKSFFKFDNTLDDIIKKHLTKE